MGNTFNPELIPKGRSRHISVEFEARLIYIAVLGQKGYVAQGPVSNK